jgi:mannose/fructose/N-acetylgalactosamine-specific phosphotransferase system component IID
MWLALLFVIVGVFIAIAGVLTGGIFTLILVPLAVIGVIAAVVYTMWGYASGAGTQQEVEASMGDPLPHSNHANVPARPNTPDELVDARQHQ